MKAFSAYVDRVASIAESASDARRLLQRDQFTAILDGQPSRELQRLVGISRRRSDGAFFTGSVLADRVADLLSGQLSKSSIVCDPACGGGDLLLACCRRLPRNDELLPTLDAWGNMLRGSDINEQFVRLAKLRLILQAIHLGSKRRRVDVSNVEALFRQLRIGNGLTDLRAIQESTHIVTNPPFSMMPTPRRCTWTSGRVNSAAVFLDVITDNAPAGTRVLAILPDVLRSGSRYAKWRNLIRGRLSQVSTIVVGRFDNHADVDVFILNGVKTTPRSSPNDPAGELFSVEAKSETISEHFDVRVGPVVPHRHAKIGRWYPYLTTHSCPAWKTIREPPRKRRFKGAVYSPPFVVVRRTSRPDDTFRAVGTIVNSKAEFAIENHLLVLIPKNGKLRECRSLLRLLKSNSTNDWLNDRIRCRHLTVGAIQSIPWNSEDR